MKKFKWRLERVLDIKKVEEQKKRTELIRIMEELTNTRSQLIMKKSVLNNLLSRINDTDFEERLRQQELFLKQSRVLDEQIQYLELRILDLDHKRKEKMQEVLKAKQFKEGLEKLREQAKTDYIKEQEKLEQKEMDEASSIRFVRKQFKETNVSVGAGSKNPTGRSGDFS